MTKQDKINRIKRTKCITLRCTPQEHEQVFAFAKASHISVSEYLLTLALDPQNLQTPDHHEFIQTVLSFKADLGRLGNLYKLGINNQIAVSETQLVLKEQQKLMKEISKFFQMQVTK